MSKKTDDPEIYILDDDEIETVAGGIKLPYPTRDDGPIFRSPHGNDTITATDGIDDLTDSYEPVQPVTAAARTDLKKTR